MRDFAVVGVVGLQGSGKTEVAEAASKFDIPRVRMGDVVWDEVKSRGLEVNESNVGAVANELREREGKAAIAKRCVPLIEESGPGKGAVLVDGIRGKAEVDEFRRVFGDGFVLLAVEASEGIRRERIGARGREDDASGKENFREKEERERGWGLDEAMKVADITIVNEGTLEQLQQRARDVLESVVSL